MSKANLSDLQTLHGKLVETLKNRIEAPLMDGEGQPLPNTSGLACTDGTLAVALALIKHEKINADVPVDNTEKDELERALGRMRERRSKSSLRSSVEATLRDIEANGLSH